MECLPYWDIQTMEAKIVATDKEISLLQSELADVKSHVATLESELQTKNVCLLTLNLPNSVAFIGIDQ
jgi:hypothetical protein